MSWGGYEKNRWFQFDVSISKLSPEDDQSILIETSSWNQRFIAEPPQLIIIHGVTYILCKRFFPRVNSFNPTPEQG